MTLACTSFPTQIAAQAGQALLESLLAMAALAVLWAGLHWLAHYQDAALSATHASRYAAFVATRSQAESSHQALVQPFFTGPAHRWTDLQGRPVLQAKSSVRLSQQRLHTLSEQAQPGLALGQAATLRRDWSLQDSGILQARVALFPEQQPIAAAANTRSPLKLNLLESAYPPLARSISILTDAGHAGSDSAVQSRLAASGLAWSRSHAVSTRAGGEVALRAAGVDEGWGRSEPDFDWLQPWRGELPRQFLSEYRSIGGGQ